MAKLPLVLVIVALFFVVSATSTEDISFDLYYETKCPYCLFFIYTQLYPGYQQLGDIFKLRVIPFARGKIVKNGTDTTVVCHHGSMECYGNKVHACSMQNNPISVWLGFIACTSATYEPYDDNVIKQCAEKYKISYDKLKECAVGEEGDKLLLENAELATKAEVIYAPHMVYNGIHDRQMEGPFKHAFAETICSLFLYPPEVCK